MGIQKETARFVRLAQYHNHQATRYAKRGLYSLAMSERCSRNLCMVSARYFQHSSI